VSQRPRGQNGRWSRQKLRTQFLALLLRDCLAPLSLNDLKWGY
jgi:hypothetical protein